MFSGSSLEGSTMVKKQLDDGVVSEICHSLISAHFLWTD